MGNLHSDLEKLALADKAGRVMAKTAISRNVREGLARAAKAPGSWGRSGYATHRLLAAIAGGPDMKRLGQHARRASRNPFATNKGIVEKYRAVIPEKITAKKRPLGGLSKVEKSMAT